MMNAGDVFVSLVVGLAVPLAILDGCKALAGDALPVQRDGFQIERRLSPWLLAVFAGPGLLIERLAEGWREKAMSRADLLTGAFIALGWAVIYGFVVLSAVNYLTTMSLASAQ